MNFIKIFSIFAGFLLISSLTSCNETENDEYIAYKSDEGIVIDVPIGISFPGIGSIEDMRRSAMILNDINVSLIKIELDWNLRELNPGEYNWEPMDQRIGYYDGQGFSLFISISTELPDCYRTTDHQEIGRDDLAAFKNFVHQVLVRYSEKIDKIQAGNEWDVRFQEDAGLWVEINDILYDETKSINKDIQVVLGAVTSSYMIYKVLAIEEKEVNYSERQFYQFDSYLERFLTNYKEHLLSGKREYMQYVFDHAKYDVVDIHMYDEGELFPDFIRILKEMTDKPILVSEFGAPNPDYEIFDEDYQYRRMKILLKTLSTLDITEAYHFSLADHDAYHSRNGIVDRFGNKKPIYYLFKNRIQR